jgi:serine/threonine-protein kinase
MSHVFVARDQALGRRVVVKILQPELAEGISVERFRREIQVAVALQHPHIVPVLSAGESEGLPYFIMPFVEGESLRARLALGPMSIPEVVRILRDVARALAYAHAQGIVHRDIKPENVLLTSGAAVVADFGVAKALSSAMRPDRTGSGASHTLTIAGTSLGTPRYMAPEQATADPNTDHRADLYAFGVMAYEMITGKAPFTASTPHELLAAHLTETPSPIAGRRANVPVALANLVTKCLEKAPRQRPQSAQEIVDALEDPAVVSGTFASSAGFRSESVRPRLRSIALGVAGVAVVTLSLVMWRSLRPPAGAVPPNAAATAAGAAAARPSIAVLPFVNIGRDSGDAYLADGLTEEVTNALGALRGVRVVPRTLAVTARFAEAALDSIGRRLGVTSVLEGTLQRSQKRLRVTARLVNTADGSMVWSDVFDGELTDVFSVQRAMSRSIADALGRELSGQHDSLVAASLPASREPTADAYAEYLRGRFLFQQRGNDGLRKSIATFEQSISKDPSYAAPHAGLAQSLSQLPHYESTLSDSAWTAAIAHANQAIALDSSLGIAWAARGAARAGQWHWADAEADLRRATVLTPNDASPHQWLGELLLVLGRVADAVTSLRRAAEVDPSSPVIAGSLAYALAIAGDTAAAIAAGNAAVAKAPDLWLTHFMLGACYISTRRMADAVRELERTQRLPGGASPLVVGLLGYAYAQSGDRARATTILKELEQGAARGHYTVPVARVALGVGDTSKALEWLERAVARRDNSFSEEPLASSVYDALRGSARFAEVVRLVGLDPRLAARRAR